MKNLKKDWESLHWNHWIILVHDGFPRLEGHSTASVFRQNSPSHSVPSEGQRISICIGCIGCIGCLAKRSESWCLHLLFLPKKKNFGGHILVVIPCSETNSWDDWPYLAINVMNWGMPSPHSTHFYTNRAVSNRHSRLQGSAASGRDITVVGKGLFARLAETVTSSFNSSILFLDVFGASNLRFHKCQIHTIHTRPQKKCIALWIIDL